MHACTLYGAIGAAIIASASLGSSGPASSRDAGRLPTSSITPPAVVAGGGDALANAAAALSPPDAPPDAPPDSPPTGSAPANAEPADEVTAAASPLRALPPNEAKPLGAPNRALSARPSADGAAGGPLASLDPRRNDAVRVGGALAVVLGLLLLTRAALRRAPGLFGGAARPAGVVEVLARYPIARGQSLVVLRMARRILLVHHAGTSMVTLSEAADPEEVASVLARLEAGARASEAGRFRAKLRDFEAEHDRVLAQQGGEPERTLDRGEIVDLTRSPGRRRGLPVRRRLTA